MATPWSKTYKAENHTFRKFRDGDHDWKRLDTKIFEADQKSRRAQSEKLGLEGTVE